MNIALIYTIVAAAALGALGVAFLVYGNMQYRRGRETLQSEIDRASTENLRKRMRADDEIAALGPDDLRRRADGWLSDDGKPL